MGPPQLNDPSVCSVLLSPSYRVTLVTPLSLSYFDYTILSYLRQTILRLKQARFPSFITAPKMADANEPVFEDDKDTLRCRFYENQYPEPEEVVMCNVTEIGEMGAYVTLLEYDNVEVIWGYIMRDRTLSHK